MAETVVSMARFKVQEAVEALEADNAPRKYTADDLRAIKADYTRKARELEKAGG